MMWAKALMVTTTTAGAARKCYICYAAGAVIWMLRVFFVSFLANHKHTHTHAHRRGEGTEEGEELVLDLRRLLEDYAHTEVHEGRRKIDNALPLVVDRQHCDG